MQTNVGLAGKTLVVGLNWSVIPKSGTGRKKEIRKACVDSGYTFGVAVEGADVAAIGLCAKKAEFPSGAAMLAAANTLAIKKRDFGDTQSSANWVLVERLKGGDKTGLYWMCAISEGVPVPGTDIIEDLAVTSARLAELVEILENVEIFSIEPEILEYVAGASPSFEKSFAELTVDVTSGKATRPQKIVGVPDWFYASLVGVAVIVGLGLGYSWYSENQAQEMKRQQSEQKKSMQAKASQEEALRKDQNYRRSDEAARKQELDKVVTSLSRAAAPLVKEWSRVVNGLALNQGGWIVERVSCDTVACLVSLSRDVNLGTNASLREVVPSAEFTEAGTASYSLPITLPPARAVSLDELSSWSDFALRVGTNLQQLKMSGLVDPSLGLRKELTYRPPAVVTPSNTGVAGAVTAAQGAVAVATSNPAQQPPPKPLGLLSGPYTIKGSSLWELSDVGEYFTGTEFSVDALTVDFGKTFGVDPTWEIKGAYYLKSAGGVPMNAVGVSGGPAFGAIMSPSLAKNGMMPMGAGPMPPNNQPLPVAPAGVIK
jgi:hypothetical protein